MSVIKLELQREAQADESFVDICCEILERYLALGELTKDGHGKVYLGSRHKVPITVCPFCGDQRGPSLVEY